MEFFFPSACLLHDYNHIAMQPEFSACSCGNVYVLSRAASRERSMVNYYEASKREKEKSIPGFTAGSFYTLEILMKCNSKQSKPEIYKIIVFVVSYILQEFY